MMKQIDYNKARARIMKAYSKGLFETYGGRRMVEVEREVYQPGPTYFDKDEVWTDPTGVERKGRFKRLPGKKVKTKIAVPQGVIAGEVVTHAAAIIESYLETLRIMEEAVLEVDSPADDEVSHLVEPMIRKATGG